MIAEVAPDWLTIQAMQFGTVVKIDSSRPVKDVKLRISADNTVTNNLTSNSIPSMKSE
jgi:hypothetical protein